MSGLLKRRQDITEEIKNGLDILNEKDPNSEVQLLLKNIDYKKTISTGSTLLDLAISSGTTEEGGIPGGLFVEVFGPSGAGKTALLSEIAASAQHRGGSVRFCDPEARLDQEYSKIYGVSIANNFDYWRPDTVSSLFGDYIWPWKPDTPNAINVLASDSIAALSTDLEMEEDEGDKMGMRRAKEFSEGLRKTCRYVAKNKWVIVFSNQLRQKKGGGKTTPGGEAIRYYATIRIEIEPNWQKPEIKKKVKLANGVEVEQTIGIYSKCYIEKNSVDIPYREVPVSIVFGYGIDTIRDELQYYKDMTKETTYNCIDKTYQQMEAACRYIEENNLQRKLKLRTIGLYREIQEKFKNVRPSKIRL